MDQYTLSEESYKNGYAVAMAEMKGRSQGMENISLLDYACVIVTENVDGEPRMILAKDAVDIYTDWRNDADMCPENDALVMFCMINGFAVCGIKDGWDFQDVMDYIENHAI